jgi:predicted alpha/beta hydrolase
MADSARSALIVPVRAADGANAQLLVQPAVGTSCGLLYWLPAMGMPARHYLPLAQALAARGISTALHEWRGIGSSDRRASRRFNWGYREVLECDIPAAMASLREYVGASPCWIGGHSLGGQVACLYASQHPAEFNALALVASGSPYWRRFAHGWTIGVGYALAPALASLMGYFPGRRLGFGGNEAQRLIADWARSGRHGVYAASGMRVDLEHDLAKLDCPVLGLRLRDDWLAPAASLDWLLSKMPHAPATRVVLANDALDGQRADHFGWMKAPAAVAAQIADHCQPHMANAAITM